VNPGQRGTPLVQVLVAGVHVGLLSEGGVIVARPLAHNGDRDARVLHEGQLGVPGA
jgi:hypothetical protein